MDHNKYKLYQLTYPYEGGTIYRSKSFKKAIKKCYREFKDLNDIKDGIFSVTDLDKNIEYQFKVRNNKVYNFEDTNSTINQDGGSLDNVNYTTQKLKDLIQNNLDPLNDKLYKVEQLVNYLMKQKDKEFEKEKDKRQSLEEENIKLMKENIYNEKLIEIQKKEDTLSKREKEIEDRLKLFERVEKKSPKEEIPDIIVNKEKEKEKEKTYEKSQSSPIKNIHSLKPKQVYDIAVERKKEFDKVNNLADKDSYCIIL